MKPSEIGEAMDVEHARQARLVGAQLKDAYEQTKLLIKVLEWKTGEKAEDVCIEYLEKTTISQWEGVRNDEDD